MFRTDNPLYREDILNSLSLDLPWEKFDGKSIMIAGATGTIGTYLVDLLLMLQEKKHISFDIIIVSRNKKRFEEIFFPYIQNKKLIFFMHDVNETFKNAQDYKPDYIFHLASNTHPVSYAREPISTILTNVLGLKNLLDYASNHDTKRVVYASSVEVYGENRGDVEKFNENYCGYIDCNTLRAGYPEGKRTGEALCQAYIAEKKLDIVIPRFSRIYGPTMPFEDSKAVSQFIKNAVNNEPIILKSDGNQLYSYAYISDAVNALLFCLFFGKNGEAYNVCGNESDIHLKDLAQTLAEISNTSVKHEIPKEKESQGFSKATKALMDSNKIKQLGWEGNYPLRKGLKRTISILRTIYADKVK